MSSTSIVQTAVRSLPVRPHRSPAGTAQAGSRPVHAVPGGLAQRRALLEARWRDRLEQVTALSLAYHDAAQNVPPGPAGRQGAEWRRARQLARQAVAERQALAEIEAALDRIASGQYGWCEQCGCNRQSVRMDFGIGAFEYWGSKEVHHDWREVCPSCEGDQTDARAEEEEA